MLTVALLCVAVAEGAVRYRSQSAHNQIVVEDKGGYRMLRFNGSMETRLLIANPLLGHFGSSQELEHSLLHPPASPFSHATVPANERPRVCARLPSHPASSGAPAIAWIALPAQAIPGRRDFWKYIEIA